MTSSLLLVVLVVAALFMRGNSPLAHLGRRIEGKSSPEQLSYLVGYMRTHGITPEQVTQAWNLMPASEPEKPQSRDIANKVMLFLGAIFILAGVCAYIHTFWDSMSSFMRIFMTLGLGMGLSAFSAVIMKRDKDDKSALLLIIMAVLFETGGWFVLLHEFFPSSNDPRGAAIFCFGVMAVKQAALFHVFRHPALLFTATAFMYAALDALLDKIGMRQQHIAILLGGSMFFTAHVISKTAQAMLSGIFYFVAAAWFTSGVFVVVEEYTRISTAAVVTGATLFLLAHAVKKQGEYTLAVFGFLIAALVLHSGIYLAIEDYASSSVAALVTGLSLCSAGYGFRKEKMDNLSVLGLFFGSAMFYCGFFDEVRHTPLELAYFAVAVGMMYGSAVLQSRALLITSVCAVLGFIGYFTHEHFMNSAAWPVALIVMGLAFLGVGSMAVRIKRKYQL